MTLQRVSTLVDLPLEIRRLVFIHHYKGVAVRIRSVGETVDTGADQARATALMQTNRQFLAEATPLFYDHATFYIKKPCNCSDAHGVLYPRCFLKVVGLRNLDLPIECIDQIGYEVRRPGELALRKPFHHTRQLHVEIESEGPLNYAYRVDLTDENGAGFIKLMTDVLSRSFELSIEITWTDAWFLGRQTLHMTDPKQWSAWRLSGDDVMLYYQYQRDFMRDWGLSAIEIRDFFVASDVQWHFPPRNDKMYYYEDQEYEQLRREYMEIDEQLARSRCVGL